MNIALVFAGGVGKRMKTSGTPKQFLEIYNKPILAYTIEKFQHNENVDAIVVVSLKEYIDKTKKIIKTYDLNKVVGITEGGKTSKESIYNGLLYIKNNLKPNKNDLVLIHDGVRPIITNKLINKNITTAKKYGNAISSSPAIETICSRETNQSDVIKEIQNRELCLVGKAPQTFFFGEILESYESVINDEDYQFVDSASLMMKKGVELHFVECSTSNIKITTPYDFYILKGILEAEENFHAFGINIEG